MLSLRLLVCTSALVSAMASSSPIGLATSNVSTGQGPASLFFGFARHSSAAHSDDLGSVSWQWIN